MGMYEAEVPFRAAVRLNFDIKTLLSISVSLARSRSLWLCLARCAAVRCRVGAAFGAAGWPRIGQVHSAGTACVCVRHCRSPTAAAAAASGQSPDLCVSVYVRTHIYVSVDDDALGMVWPGKLGACVLLSDTEIRFSSALGALG